MIIIEPELPPPAKPPKADPFHRSPQPDPNPDADPNLDLNPKDPQLNPIPGAQAQPKAQKELEDVTPAFRCHHMECLPRT